MIGKVERRHVLRGAAATVFAIIAAAAIAPPVDAGAPPSDDVTIAVTMRIVGDDLSGTREVAIACAGNDITSDELVLDLAHEQRAVVSVRDDLGIDPPTLDDCWGGDPADADRAAYAVYLGGELLITWQSRQRISWGIADFVDDISVPAEYEVVMWSVDVVDDPCLLDEALLADRSQLEQLAAGEQPMPPLAVGDLVLNGLGSTGAYWNVGFDVYHWLSINAMFDITRPLGEEYSYLWGALVPVGFDLTALDPATLAQVRQSAATGVELLDAIEVAQAIPCAPYELPSTTVAPAPTTAAAAPTTLAPSADPAPALVRQPMYTG